MKHVFTCPLSSSSTEFSIIKCSFDIVQVNSFKPLVIFTGLCLSHFNERLNWHIGDNMSTKIAMCIKYQVSFHYLQIPLFYDIFLVVNQYGQATLNESCKDNRFLKLSPCLKFKINPSFTITLCRFGIIFSKASLNSFSWVNLFGLFW